MSKYVTPLSNTLNFNTANVNLCIEDLTDEEAKAQMLGGHPTSMAWELGHLISNRYVIAGIIGLDETDPRAEKFWHDSASTDGSDYPHIKELLEDYNRLGSLIKNKLESLTDEAAMADSGKPFPMQESTVQGGVAFFTWHDSYHTGRIGAIRTQMKKPSIQKMFHEKYMKDDKGK